MIPQDVHGTVLGAIKTKPLRVGSTDFVRALTGETALATLIRHAVLHHHAESKPLRE